MRNNSVDLSWKLPAGHKITGILQSLLASIVLDEMQQILAILMQGNKQYRLRKRINYCQKLLVVRNFDFAKGVTSAAEFQYFKVY